MKQHHLELQIRASYHTLNDLSSSTKRVWLVFHGYGQLSEFFIKKFAGLDPQTNFIIAPQGLSKFYLDESYGRVGASWLTKEDRLNDIKNQHSYIDALLSKYDVSAKKLIYFGFSQGTATMVRYAAYAHNPFEKMILWAGRFPQDTSAQDWTYLNGDEQIESFLSKEDRYIVDGLVEEQKETIRKALGRDARLHWYEGGHRVIPELVSKL